MNVSLQWFQSLYEVESTVGDLQIPFINPSLFLAKSVIQRICFYSTKICPLMMELTRFMPGEFDGWNKSGFLAWDPLPVVTLGWWFSQ